MLIRNPEEGVAMDDLDQLQQDLEKLLSTNALRSRFFLGEHSHSHSGHDRRHERLSLKRKRDDVPKYKDMFVSSKNGLRVIKRDPFRSFSEKSFKEIPKITLPRNDNSDKFWASIEPYCSPVSKDDIAVCIKPKRKIEVFSQLFFSFLTLSYKNSPKKLS